MELGHFFLAIDPKLFRDTGEFEETVDELIDHLHDTAPVDPNRPVLVAGEPEAITRVERHELGVPIADGLVTRIEALANRWDVPFLLT